MSDGQRVAALYIYGVWLLWAAIWLAMAYGTKAVARQESRLSRALHIVPLGVAAALLAGPVPNGGILNAEIAVRGSWMVWAGAACVTVGLGFALWARLTIAGNWSGTVTLKEAHELISTGPYALVRHPIYTGLLTGLLGNVLAIDAWRALAALLIVLLSFLRKMRTEEAFMRAQFGPRYDDYARVTPSLLPRIGI